MDHFAHHPNRERLNMSLHEMVTLQQPSNLQSNHCQQYLSSSKVLEQHHLYPRPDHQEYGQEYWFTKSHHVKKISNILPKQQMTPGSNRHGMQHIYIVGFDLLGTADIFHHCVMWGGQKMIKWEMIQGCLQLILGKKRTISNKVESVVRLF